MILSLYRYASKDGATLGELFVDGVFECYTLEDVVRDTKIHGQTAIPVGAYRVEITYSPRFRVDLPLLHDVPNFSGIRIHPGNRAEDTEGCILVGTTISGNTITSSRVAFNALFAKIARAQGAGEPVSIEILSGQRA